MKKSEIQILIVEDDPSLSSSLLELVKKMGFKGAAVSKVDEALNFVKIKPVQMAIVDCMLPKMSGVDLVMQFRESRFGDSPVVLTSGIFKDKAFATEAIKKTGAIRFLSKPFDTKEMRSIIEQAVGSQVANAEITLNSFLSKQTLSAREQLKAVEVIEELKGYELPVIVSVLMSAEFSGHLNLADANGGIFGVSFKKGEIIKFDGPDSRTVTESILVGREIMTSEEMQDYKAKKVKGDLLVNLVEENLLSPHFIPTIKNQQVLTELKSLFSQETVKLNLVPDRIRENGAEIKIAEIIPLFEEGVEKLDIDFLRSFYEPWLTFPIRKNPQYSESHPALKASLLRKIPDVKNLIEGDLNLEDILNTVGDKQETFYRILHLLALARLIYFDDVKAVAGAEEYGKRMMKIRDEITGKNFEEIFRYFGASSAMKPTEIEKIYKEFAKANHPDSIPPTAPEEVRTAVTAVFSLVSAANDVLTDPIKREGFYSQLKQNEAGRQMQAEGYAEEGLNHLKKGRVGVAMPKLRQAYELYPNSNHLVYLCWGELKAMGDRPDATKLQEVTKNLDSIPVEDRRTPQYQLVAGLLKRAEGDFDGAYASFDKALALDAAFLDARREISGLSTARKVAKKGSSIDLNEITSTISNFFKKKAD